MQICSACSIETVLLEVALKFIEFRRAKAASASLTIFYHGIHGKRSFEVRHASLEIIDHVKGDRVPWRRLGGASPHLPYRLLPVAHDACG